MQTKRQTVIEVCSNTAIGMLGSWLIMLGVLHLLQNKLAISALTVVLCTAWSLFRGYLIRRHFNGKLNKTQVKKNDP